MSFTPLKLTYFNLIEVVKFCQNISHSTDIVINEDHCCMDDLEYILKNVVDDDYNEIVGRLSFSKNKCHVDWPSA